ncbi:MAG TPA: hypothetical protein VJ385_22775, partial [Fibrobacteria bacterium]|nr:hypothetical protein [Fibrobacteria bacterium]
MGDTKGTGGSPHARDESAGAAARGQIAGEPAGPEPPRDPEPAPDPEPVGNGIAWVTVGGAREASCA